MEQQVALTRRRLLVATIAALATGCLRPAGEPGPRDTPLPADPPAVGPTPTPPPASATATVPPAAPDPRLMAADREFAFGLLRQTVRADHPTNRFVSPLSVSLALALLYNGATDETQREIAHTLGVEGLSLDQVNAANAALLASLERQDSKVQLTSAQSVWVDQRAVLQSDFVQRAQQAYRAEAQSLDLAGPSAAATINDWVAARTDGRIEKLVERVDAEVLLLLNAIVFKGAWAEAFDRAGTQDGAFTLPGGQRTTVPMMAREGTYRYLRGDTFQAVGLAYADGRTTLYAFVPQAGVGLDDFLVSLDDAHWQQWLRQFAPMRMILRLPRFTLKDQLDLAEPLKALGLRRAFDPDRANLDGLVANLAPGLRLFVSQARHAAVVQVDEEGTVAAAATGLGLRPTSLPPTVSVDRPFVFAIADDQSGALLFVGTLVDPR